MTLNKYSPSREPNTKRTIDFAEIEDLSWGKESIVGGDNELVNVKVDIIKAKTVMKYELFI